MPKLESDAAFTQAFNREEIIFSMIDFFTMRLKKISLSNFLSYSKQETIVEFGPSTCVVGPNDSGKSNLIRTIEFVGNMLANRSSDVSAYYHNRDLSNPFSITVDVEFSDREADALTDACICSHAMDVLTANETGKPADAFNLPNQRFLRLQALEKFGMDFFRPLFSGGVSINVHSSDKMTIGPTITLISERSGRSLYLHLFGLISNYRTMTGSYTSISLIDHLRNEMALHPDTVKVDDTIPSVLNQPGYQLPSIYEAMRSGNDTAPVLGINLLRHNPAHCDNSLIDFLPLKRLYSFLISRFGMLPPALLISPYDVLELIYRDSITILSQESFLPAWTLESLDQSVPSGYVISEAHLPALLFSLKNYGTQIHRRWFDETACLFKELSKMQAVDVFLRPTTVNESEPTELTLLEEKGNQPQNPFDKNTVVTPLRLALKSSTKRLHELSVEIKKNEKWLPLSSCGQGIAQLLLISTAIAMSRDRILVMDEPAQNLHPSMQARIMKLIREDDGRGMQSVIVTHSPYFVETSTLQGIIHVEMHDGHSVARDLVNLLRQEEFSGENENKMGEKIRFCLRNPEVRALLFAKGIVLVEGPSDGIVVERVDRHFSLTGEGANLNEFELPIIEAGGKTNIGIFLLIARLLNLNHVAIVDRDALMAVENDNMCSLARSLDWARELGEDERIELAEMAKRAKKIRNSRGNEVRWYNEDDAEWLGNFASEHGFFVFQKDLEEALQSPNTPRDKKPLRAIGRVMAQIEDNKLSSEFYHLIDFLRKKLI